MGLESFDGYDGDNTSTSGQSQPPRRVFNAWTEDWERAEGKKDDVVVKEKFLQKYDGIRFLDHDNSTNDSKVVFQCNGLSFNKRQGGWLVVAVDGEGSEDMFQPGFVVDCVYLQERGVDNNGDVCLMLKQDDAAGIVVHLPVYDVDLQPDTDDEA